MTRNRSFFYLVALLILAGLFSGCQKKKVPEIEIIARIGDAYLTRTALVEWMPRDVPADQKEVVAQQYIDLWVKNTLLEKAARRANIALTPHQEWLLRNLRKEMLAEKYLDTRLPAQLTITDAEISEYYQKHKEEFKRDRDEVHLVQLFLETLDRAIARDIKESKSLLDVVRKNYLDTQQTRLLEENGDLGYVPVSDLRPEIQRRVRAGKTGRIYGPIRLASGFYYFQMLDKQPKGSYRSLDLVADQIRLRLTTIKRLEQTKEIVRKLQENNKVEIHLENLK